MNLALVGLGLGLSLVVAIGALVLLVELRTGPGPAALAGGPGQFSTAAGGSGQFGTATAAGTSADRRVPANHRGPVPRPGGTASLQAGGHRGVGPRGQIQSYLAGRSGVVTAAVYDVATRQTWTIGKARQTQTEASIVKVDILETLLAQARGGGLSATDQALAQQMIEDSDNDAATALWNAAGGANGIRAYNAAIGLASTTPSSCLQCPGFPWPGWGLSTTTPADQITLLRELTEPSSFVSTAERDSALRLMENVTPSQRWGVSGGVPAQATVALKNGWLPLNDAQTDWQINSVGWISGLGRNYLIAVLSTGNPTEQYGIDTIDGLSAIVWNGL